jgi:SAM-dependent methyltransferase
MKTAADLEQVKAYFAKRIATHGASPRGADWNSEVSQQLRFDQLLKLVQGEDAFSILDFGSGYGALADHLEQRGLSAEYVGYDMLDGMVQAARARQAGKAGRTFTSDKSALPIVDYVVASGTFNFRGDASFEAWTDLVIGALTDFDRLSRRGFASNFLTKYSDADRMRGDLYYADPLQLFDYCKRHFSRDVALLHDYELYDFTLIVRKRP